MGRLSVLLKLSKAIIGVAPNGSSGEPVLFDVLFFFEHSFLERIRMALFGENEEAPLVSILVLSYRNVDGLFPTLESILEQDYPNIEIIVSDDGTEGFGSFIPELNSFVSDRNRGNVFAVDIYTLESNMGTVKNANLAVSRAHGRYIKTISPDDRFAKTDAVARYVRFMREEKCLVAFAKLRGVDDAGNYVNKLASCDDDYDTLRKLSPEQILNRLYARNFLPGAAEFFDCKIFEKYGLFPEKIKLIEDYSYWLHLAGEGVRFGFLDEVLIDYRLSGVSSAGHYGEAFMEDMYAIYDEYIFPNDTRFGLAQPLYNKLKRWGLDYYMAKARVEELSGPVNLLNKIRYSPFALFAYFQAVRIRVENARVGF